MSDNERLRAALAQIARISMDAALGAAGPDIENPDDPYADGEPSRVASESGCTLKSLPQHLVEEAAARAVRINPLNRPVLGAHLGFGEGVEVDRLAITLLTSKYWGRGARNLTVSFLDNPSAELRRRILSHLNAWNSRCGIRFVETGGTGQVRIARGPGGYWSYLGTDILLIPRSRPTMNLEGFTMNTSEREYRRVVRHEAGHTLGFTHEHARDELVARIDREKAYAYFWETQGWRRQEVDQQVLTPLSRASIMGTAADQTSIMCYQLPAKITRDGRPILGGLDINETDFNFAARIYPKPGAATQLDEIDDAFEGTECEESAFDRAPVHASNAADPD